MSVSNMTKFVLPHRFKESTYSIWVEFVSLAEKYEPLNLGQGFPDYNATKYVQLMLNEVATTKDSSVHQYTNDLGHPRLINVLSKLYSKLLNRRIDPSTEILVTYGAYEALYSVIGSNVDVGDEVILVEPYYDCYASMVRVFGGVPRFIPLENVSQNRSGISSGYSSWILDEGKLSCLFNEKTKIFLLNTPHNPTGKVFTYEELKIIANLCQKFNVICLSDEVYEWLVYKPAVHTRIATLPGMWERTLTIGSAGKTFSVTGWKCGWLYGPDYLIKNAAIAHLNNICTYNTPIQEAVALCFEKELLRLDEPECYFQNLANTILLPKRDMFVKILKDIGFTPLVPEAGIFMLADYSKIVNRIDLSSETDPQQDFKFSKWMIKNIKLLGIPPSAFYSSEHKYLAANYIRFCFFKKDETLKEAECIFNAWNLQSYNT